MKVGDFAGQDRGDCAVTIQIVRVDPDEIEAVVVELGNFYSARRLKDGFVIGETLLLRPNGFKDQWVIHEPQHRPWHVLGVGDYGDLYFEHYR